MCFDFLRIVALPDDGGLVAALVEMAVDAIPGDVEDAVLETISIEMLPGAKECVSTFAGFDPADTFWLRCSLQKPLRDR